MELLSADAAGGEDAVASCNAMALLGGEQRLVIVEGVERWKAADVKAVSSYLADPAPDTVLALVASGVKKDSALAKACAKAGDVLAYDVVRRRLPDWVAKHFAERGVTIDGEAARVLVEIVGEDPEELASEIDKIATWAGDDPVSVADVERLAAGCAEVPGFDLTDAWGRRDLPGALSACQTLLERSGDAVSRSVPKLIALLVGHVARVRDCQSFAAAGLTAKEAAARLKRHPFYVEKLYAQARNYDADELREAIVRLAELDHAVKGGSRLAVDLELERALIDITRAREPAAAAV